MQVSKMIPISVVLLIQSMMTCYVQGFDCQNNYKVWGFPHAGCLKVTADGKQVATIAPPWNEERSRYYCDLDSEYERELCCVHDEDIGDTFYPDRLINNCKQIDGTDFQWPLLPYWPSGSPQDQPHNHPPS
ncbi:hypothetical protein PGT21_011292 [Puccinia graminis f. sp. tritici]|uniref:Secreted protein n=1 Tax=Puccinia graminis f. sp. tritici TaxID=56615 RepID=A0A5B0SHK6_PUCGR|nr:hypothetical protein PGT21_011292 [Puccinia graminis f. sp. tritici]KAA1135974.1 hypothetical protein PGTUg99_014618 [Puccinia graminis f. sp. tritici]